MANLIGPSYYSSVTSQNYTPLNANFATSNLINGIQVRDQTAGGPTNGTISQGVYAQPVIFDITNTSTINSDGLYIDNNAPMAGAGVRGVVVRVYDRLGNLLGTETLTVPSGTYTGTVSFSQSYTGVASWQVQIDSTYGNGQQPMHIAEIGLSGTVAAPDAIVQGVNAGEVMGLGYTDLDGTVIGNWPDSIYGYGGNDTIFSGGGNDWIDGGTGNDVIDAGTGNDTILGGDGTDAIIGGVGSDFIDGGNNDDTVDGGLDDDTVHGGAGNDVVLGGAGDDLLYGEDGNDKIDGGAGNDVIYGGVGDDKIDGGDGNDYIDGGTSADIITGGLGNDTLLGGGSTDTLDGGAGDDSLDGGLGNDKLTGGAGFDTLDGGAGSDVLTGGGDADVFIAPGVGGGNDTITDFGTGSGSIHDGNSANNDYVDLTGHYNWTTYNAAVAAGAINPALIRNPLQWMQSDYAADGVLNSSFAGWGPTSSLSILNNGVRVATTDLITETTGVICYTHGTLIETISGPQPIELLQVGDLVRTLDHGYQPLRWIGIREMPAVGRLAPVTIAAGRFGNRRPLTVSQQHRMLIQTDDGDDGCFIAAKKLVDGLHAQLREGGSVRYIHLLFDRHEVIFAEGARSESLYLGREGWKTMTEEARREILSIFPALAFDAGTTTYGPLARPAAAKPGRMVRQMALHAG